MHEARSGILRLLHLPLRAARPQHADGQVRQEGNRVGSQLDRLMHALT